MVLKGFDSGPHLSSRIYKGLESRFLEEEDDKTYVFSIIDNLLQYTPNPSGKTSASTQMTDTSRTVNFSERKLAITLPQSSEKEECFKGKLTIS